uniref:Uncharacterized protein n=1 Tax=Lotharella oceanica TaxID=641309 RepID=A0A7S2TRJ0_9EUKA|mmetsp:Transcript_24816/g.46381  ORF Transcript_24816/g.46381 Transcript_24816/m.46381 type:complete len:193 (+) Transcript_24816:56-634(+)|eukprot:CAMPEP_0170181052 /NCGR_PEP_ID=MMETSP0040_2-20121228/23816_1 /TAXON_ID=641309 /ORGANISM="Lotharella oceanica, Strain CCMP622" /LENGTH=192 /DNA_ID=CAMNT_0010425929 /DNA_START=12 /DNA_END=590 /DNA_ORIENTATION=-
MRSFVRRTLGSIRQPRAPLGARRLCCKAGTDLLVKNKVSPLGSTGLVGLAQHVLRPWVPGARSNVLLNRDEDSKFKYIEINQSEIRLEFQDTDSPVYQYYTSYWTALEEVGEAVDVRRPKGLDLREHVKDIRNNTFCGAGATVFLCREGVTSVLKQHLGISAEGTQAEADSSQDREAAIDVPSEPPVVQQHH